MKNSVFITGATSGFGRAIAINLAQQGYKIIALGRRKERLDELAVQIEHIHTIACDIRDKEAVFCAVEQLPEKFKDVEVLVNNAGLALGQESVMDASLDDFEVMIDTNIKGLLYATKAVLPIMKARNSGYIFNIGSVAGDYPYFGANVYGGTKAFVKQFSLNLKNDLRDYAIRSTLIAPGLCKTEFSEVRFKGDKQRADAVYEGTQYITAQDIAQTISSCLAMPKNVNINSIELMSSTQSWAGFKLEKK